jgi:hypothetical protein
MSPTFLDDLDIVDPATVETGGPAYPVAQWLNGDPKLAAAGGVAHTGGLILPGKYLDGGDPQSGPQKPNGAAGWPPPGWTRATVAFSSGKSEAVLAAPKPRLAVIRTRFRWFVVYNGVTTFYPRSGYQADSGMRGHVQALCAVHGFDFPIVVTFKGKASQEFERLLREFSQKVQEAAYRVSREAQRGQGNGQTVAPGQNRFPRFAFYMRLAPGPHVKVGQKGQESIITPPVLELPTVISEEYLSKIYVGRDRLQDFQQLFHASAEWASAWDRPGAEETADDHEIDAPVAEPF